MFMHEGDDAETPEIALGIKIHLNVLGETFSSFRSPHFEQAQDHGDVSQKPAFILAS